MQQNQQVLVVVLVFFNTTTGMLYPKNENEIEFFFGASRSHSL